MAVSRMLGVYVQIDLQVPLSRVLVGAAQAAWHWHPLEKAFAACAAKALSGGNPYVVPVYVAVSLGKMNTAYAIVAAVMLLAVLWPGLGSTTETASSAAYTPHAPIGINENYEFNSTNGIVSGSGTRSDPYIIEGWEILLNETGTAISVYDTTVDFIIRNVHVKGAIIGISIYNATDGKVDESLVESCSAGIRISYSSDCRIEDSTLVDNGIGIVLLYSEDTKLDDITYINNDRNLYKKERDWITGTLGTTVCVAILIPLAIIVALLVYFRFRPPKEFGPQPPKEETPKGG